MSHPWSMSGSSTASAICLVGRDNGRGSIVKARALPREQLWGRSELRILTQTTSTMMQHCFFLMDFWYLMDSSMCSFPVSMPCSAAFT